MSSFLYQIKKRDCKRNFFSTPCGCFSLYLYGSKTRAQITCPFGYCPGAAQPLFCLPSSNFVNSLRTAKTLSTITASTPAAISNLAFMGSLLADPYVKHAKPLALTTLANLGQCINGTAWLTIPNNFHVFANLMAFCNELALISAIFSTPLSVRNKTGNEGCFMVIIIQISG